MRALGAARLLLTLLLDLRRVAESYEAPYWKVLSRVVFLCRRYGFGPREVVAFGLADPTLPPSAFEGCLGKRAKLALQRRLNPKEWECLTADKVVFHAYCERFGVPTPEVIAVVRSPAGGAVSSRRIRSRQEWYDHFSDDSAFDEFVVKPTCGQHGRAVSVWKRANGGFVDSAGHISTPQALVDRMLDDSDYSHFLIQERVRPHAALAELTGSPYVQTIRIESVFRSDGSVNLFAPRLRLIGGDSFVDNYRKGLVGNLVAVVSLMDGRLGPVYAPRDKGLGLARIDCHPRTGRAFDGFRVPFWRETILLIERIAPLFLPVRTLGWDVAITPSGPIVIEANPEADPSHNIAAPRGWPGERTLAAELRHAAAEPHLI